MQSFTTQSHERNYQGSVVLPRASRSPKKGRKIMGFALSVMTLAAAVMGGLWGATAVHNFQLKQQVATVSTATTQSDTPVAVDTEKEDHIVYPTMTLEEYPAQPVDNNEQAQTNTKKQEQRRTYPMHKKRPLKALMADENSKETYQAQIVRN